MSAFDGKVVLITGGRSGIGAAAAQRFARDGARVFTAQRGEEPEFEGVSADFLEQDAPQQVVDQVVARAGRLDVLVNNAGLMREGTCLEMSAKDWADTLQLNLTAPFLLTKFALPHLIETHGAIEYRVD